MIETFRRYPTTFVITGMILILLQTLLIYKHPIQHENWSNQRGKVHLTVDASNIQTTNPSLARLRSEIQHWLCPATVDNDFDKFNA